MLKPDQFLERSKYVTGCHNIAEIMLKVALNTKNQIISIIKQLA
jgi:hypothetical protein